MKREESDHAIQCYLCCGPIFGNVDIFINDNCMESCCHIDNDGTHGYNCHPLYKKSLFVNSDESDKVNSFVIYDYEVFTPQ